MAITTYQVVATNNDPFGSSFMGATAGPTYLVTELQNLKADMRILSLGLPWVTLAGLTGAWTGATGWTYLSPTSASIPGDQTVATGTGYLMVGGRVRATISGGYVYGQITSLTVGAGPITTATFVWDAGSLNSTLTDIQIAGDPAGVPNAVVTQMQTPLYCQITNSGAAWTGTLTPAIAALVVGQQYQVNWGAASQGSDTLNLNGLGAKPIKKLVGGSLVNLAAGDIPSGAISNLIYDGTNFQLTSPDVTPSGLWGSRNLKGTAPGSATTMSFTADLVEAWQPSTGQIMAITSLNATVNIGTAGPALNGRDQSAAFTASTFIHIYAITGLGQTPGLIASATAPPTGPTLPTNYTNFAYLATVLLDGSGNIVQCYVRDQRVTYENPVLVLNGGSATTFTAQSSSAGVPAIATNWCGMSAMNLTVNSGSKICQILLSIDGVNVFTQNDQIIGNGVNSAMLWGYQQFIMPNVSQTFYYYQTNTSTNTPLIYVWVESYDVPNG